MVEAADVGLEGFGEPLLEDAVESLLAEIWYGLFDNPVAEILVQEFPEIDRGEFPREQRGAQKQGVDECVRQRTGLRVGFEDVMVGLNEMVFDVEDLPVHFSLEFQDLFH